LGLKKNRINNLILVFDEIIPDNRLSKIASIMSSFSTHNIKNTGWRQHGKICKIRAKLPISGKKVA
jgi:hypothetical protein